MRILVAEDDKGNQIAISALMERLGCEVHIVTNGSEAVSAFAVGKYDLVLMDLMMPVCDGLAATTAIRACQVMNSERTPIIAMTASTVEARQCRHAGMDDFLAKPYSMEDLRELLAKYKRDRFQV